MRNVGAHFGGQRRDKSRGLGWIQMRQNQRDGLRMLAVDEFGELLRIGFLQRVETQRLVGERLHQPVQHSLAAFSAPKAVTRTLRAYSTPPLIT